MKIVVDCDGEQVEITQSGGATLYEYLLNAGLQVDSACGGNGTCFKCRVQMKQGFVATSTMDRKAFTAAELADGWRLSCQARPKTNVELQIPKIENHRRKPRVLKNPYSLQNPFLVCDVGSTGVVAALADKHGQIAGEAHLLNRQVRYGSDVMTRLCAVQKWGMTQLCKTLSESIVLCLQALKEAFPTAFAIAQQKPIMCSGNSAMVSFLHGWNTETLAVSPFQPLRRDSTTSIIDTFACQTLPLLGGFVGADTVAGILFLEQQKAKTPWMMVDIGTNTEVVLKSDLGEYWFASAPAGPAFEGGNITKGMRAEAGAICRAFHDEKWRIETIGNDVPRGICGSGLIDLLFEAVRAGILTRDGYLPQGRLDVTERVFLLADDVREFQLAKSATRTAIDILIKRAQVKPLTIYLAGAFAEHLRDDATVGVGLIPPGIPMQTIGNASLKGTIVYAALNDDERGAFTAKLERGRRPIELALQDDFQDAFVENLNF